MELLTHCENCNKIFIAYKVYLDKDKKHFCSWECFKEYRGY